MKTTVNIDDTVMVELKREAARQGRTISELVETALRLLLRSQRFPMLRRVRHRAARLARRGRTAVHPGCPARRGGAWLARTAARSLRETAADARFRALGHGVRNDILACWHIRAGL
jgi:Ribbon-helix-helix protein, copG family